jgi:hypothetical protein
MPAMATSITLQELLVPIVIAATTVAFMMWFSGRAPKRPVQTLDYKPDPTTSLSMTLARYVGGHPAIPTPVASPFALLTDRHLALYARRGGAMLFQLAWDKVEQVTALDRAQMEAASASVRGLVPDAFEASPPEARFLRIRFEDERGWWQNVVLELAPAHADEQEREVTAYWESYGA